MAMSMPESGKMEEALDRAATNSHLVESTRVKYGTVNLMVSVSLSVLTSSTSENSRKGNSTALASSRRQIRKSTKAHLKQI